MNAVLLVLVAAAALLLTAYIAVVGVRDLIGTRAQHRRRGRAAATAFDGSPEVRVRWDGAGTSIEQLVWYGRQQGYDLYRLSGSGGGARTLVMRRLPYGTPPRAPQRYGQPDPTELAAIARDVRRTVNPEAIWRLTGLLTVLTGVAAYTAYDQHQSGSSFGVAAVSALVLAPLAGGVSIAGRVALRRRSRRFLPYDNSARPQTGSQR
ncbi:hypothetical protein [Streptomyces sp. NBC_01465]|uniref:hypothetical protein n=1 Tax=Streptomyces sp. NBC_01465 TaxID=2903878 RepID=UPI002E36A9F0|nr:hypothetical protein [Streptomyces sp. NBC_01465]